jgi:hypothetical protein
MAGSNQCDPETFDDGLKALSPVALLRLRLADRSLEKA